MLVIKRNCQEKVILKIGTEVVTIWIVQGNNVRLGIEASKDVEILRAELFGDRRESA